MNINKLAIRVTEREGGKEKLSIAQVKEVISCLNEQLKVDTYGDFNLYAMLRSFKEADV